MSWSYGRRDNHQKRVGKMLTTLWLSWIKIMLLEKRSMNLQRKNYTVTCKITQKRVKLHKTRTIMQTLKLEKNPKQNTCHPRHSVLF